MTLYSTNNLVNSIILFPLSEKSPFPAKSNSVTFQYKIYFGRYFFTSSIMTETDS